MEVREVRELARGTSPSPGTATAQAEVSSAADPGRCRRGQQNKGAPGMVGGLGASGCRGHDGSSGGGTGACLGWEEALRGEGLACPPWLAGGEGRLTFVLILRLLQTHWQWHGSRGVQGDIAPCCHHAGLGAVFARLGLGSSLTSPQKA